MRSGEGVFYLLYLGHLIAAVLCFHALVCMCLRDENQEMTFVRGEHKKVSGSNQWFYLINAS